MRVRAFFLFAVSTLATAQVHRVPAQSQWFPDNAIELKRVLDEAFRIAEHRIGPVPPRKQLLGIIAPHAALSYSGAVAAAAYSRLDHPKNVILLALNHRRRLEGIAAPALDSYSTPLGDLRVNREAVRALGFRTEPESQLCDHSLENQLPFILRAAPGAGLIPLYVGDLSADELASAAKKLSGRLKQGDLIVASSDLTHYGEAYQYTPFPNDADIARRLRERALGIFDRIGSLNVPLLDGYVNETRDNLCGREPIRLLMAALARFDEEVYLSPIDYLASGELAHDYRISVGYGALAFYPASAFSVSAADQAKLLRSARRTLGAFTAGEQKKREEVPADERDADLEQHSALFVTLKKNGELRGCIGTFEPRLPLWDAVADRTLAAAGADLRFGPIRAEEGPLSLEISLLTPLKRLADRRDFRLGHGALLTLGEKSGTLLPQVAAEMHWSREEFLENLSLKAGLPRKAYRDPRAVLSVYSAQVFSEPADRPVEEAAAAR